jgi:hypothetical protein
MPDPLRIQLSLIVLILAICAPWIVGIFRWVKYPVEHELRPPPRQFVICIFVVFIGVSISTYILWPTVPVESWAWPVYLLLLALVSLAAFVLVWGGFVERSASPLAFQRLGVFHQDQQPFKFWLSQGINAAFACGAAWYLWTMATGDAPLPQH